MADLYATELAGVFDGTVPTKLTDGSVHHAKLHRMRATITLASQATTDNVLLGKLPTGAVLAFGVLTASATLGTSVIAIGTNKVHGSNGDYRAAATFTAADTPTFFGKAAAAAGTPLTAETSVYLTIATAALPASGTLVVDLYYSRR